MRRGGPRAAGVTSGCAAINGVFSKKNDFFSSISNIIFTSGRWFWVGWWRWLTIIITTIILLIIIIVKIQFRIKKRTNFFDCFFAQNRNVLYDPDHDEQGHEERHCDPTNQTLSSNTMKERVSEIKSVARAARYCDEVDAAPHVALDARAVRPPAAAVVGRQRRAEAAARVRQARQRAAAAPVRRGE